MTNTDFNLDSFFGLERELVVFDITEGGELFFMQLALALFFWLISLIFGTLAAKLSPRLERAYGWLSRLFYSHTLLFSLFLGVALWISKNELSVGRGLYLYVAIFILTAIGQIVVERHMPADATSTLIESEFGRINTNLPSKGEVPNDI